MSAGLRGLMLVVSAAALAGCGGTIFRTVDLNQGESLVMDARQRTVNNLEVQPGSRPGHIRPRRVVCAEPSPDVALAVANSLSAGVSVFGYGSGSLTREAAEGIAQLAERVSTVQLLRDVLYRACEAYANGAITDITYAMMMARLDETTVTLLLGELAAGAFGRQLAGLGSAAEGKAATELSQTLKVKAEPATGSQPSTTKADVEGKASVTAPGPIGTIAGRGQSPEVAAEVARIHRAFLKDANLDALMVACVTALSQESAGALAAVCKTEVFAGLERKVTTIVAARTQAEVALREVAHRRAAAEAVARCFEAQAKAPERTDACDKVVDAWARTLAATR